MDTLADMAAAVVHTAARVLAAAGAPAVGAQGAAPVAEGAGDTEQRISRTVPGLPRGNLTVAVLKSRLQMYGGAMFVLDDKTRYKAPNEHIFNKGVIKRAELIDAWRRFMATPSDRGGFDPARMLSEDDLVVRKAAPGSRAGTRRGARRGAAATVPTAYLPSGDGTPQPRSDEVDGAVRKLAGKREARLCRRAGRRRALQPPHGPGRGRGWEHASERRRQPRVAAGDNDGGGEHGGGRRAEKGYADGGGAAARFNRTTAVMVDKEGTIVVADKENLACAG
jgi:hypothetical protein